MTLDLTRLWYVGIAASRFTKPTASGYNIPIGREKMNILRSHYPFSTSISMVDHKLLHIAFLELWKKFSQTPHLCIPES